MLLRLITLLLIFTCLSWRFPDGHAAEILTTHPSLRATPLPRLISAREFYGRSYKTWWHQISPDGRRLASVSIHMGKLSFQIRTLDDGREFLMKDLGGVTSFTWTLDSRHVVFRRIVDRRGNRHLFVGDTDSPGKPPRDITPFDGVDVRSSFVLLGNPAAVLVTMNLRDRRSYDLYQINLYTGERELLATNDGNTADWIVNRNGEVLARVQKTADGAWDIQAIRPGGMWETVLNGTFRDTARYHSNLLEDNTTVHVQTNAGRDKQSIIGLDLRTGTEELIFGVADSDVSSLWIDPTTDKPLIVQYFDPLPRYHFFDPTLQKDLERLIGTAPILYSIFSASLDHMRLLLRAETARQAPSVYLVDRRSGTKELLATHPMNAFADDLSDMRPIQFVARDGLRINGFLTLPNGTDGNRLPTVVKVHGGPWMQDQWGFDTQTQFLANRGYAVLAVNFRGSTGVGKAFMEKGRKELGRKMQTDLIDAVDWAIAQGHTDPDRVAIYGHSYGGYAALMAMAQTPRKFAAGISVMGVTDLALLIDDSRSNPEKFAWWLHFAGNTSDAADHRELVRRSPVTHASRIQRPLLLFHGAKDTRVSKEHFDRLLVELRKGDASVDYLVFPKEGHEIMRTANKLKFARRVERFLARHLGGRAEPLN